jgi:hypothetical protein
VTARSEQNGIASSKIAKNRLGGHPGVAAKPHNLAGCLAASCQRLACLGGITTLA